MAGYRDPFLKLFGKTAGTLPVRLLMNMAGRRLILPVYHLVSDQDVPHIKHLYQVKRSAAFTEDIDFLLHNFHPLSYDELKELAISGRQPSKPSFFLTFDDGLSEFYEVIAPILVKKGITAINFLNSDFVDNKDLFFRYKASLLIEKIQSGKGKHQAAVSAWLTRNFPSQQEVVPALLGVKYHNRNLLDQLALQIDLDFGGYLKEKQPYLTSEQINSLQQQGFYFGAHSADHPEYRFITLQEQLRQTAESAAWVHETFHTPDKLFAFPFTDYGVSKAFFDRVFDRAAPVLDFSFGSAGLKNEEFQRHLHRIPFEMGEMKPAQILNTELLYYLFKQPLGKNTLHRK